MSSLYFPLASLLVSILLVTIFYNKKRVKNEETKMYSRMIIINLIETITAIAIITIAKTIGTNQLVFLLDRIDFILISLWCSDLFIYVYNISFENQIENKRNTILMLKTLIIVSLLFSGFKIINYDDIIDTSGLAPTLVSFYCGFFAASMLCCLLIVVRRKDKQIPISKFYPLFVFIVLILVSLFLRKFWPTMVLEPFMISFIDLIMFFTIENPDLKMIDELTHAKEVAEKYGNEKTVFLFNMSQNVRKPLNNIDILTEHISESNDIDEIKQSVSSIKSSVQQLQYIVNNSLDISTLVARNLKVMDEKYDLKMIIEQLKLKVNTMINQDKITFNCNISEALPKKFYGDSIRIKQILSTLLFNSVKHTESGFIELNIDSIIKNDICRLIISVEDSGCGIKTKEIDKLFEKHDVEECATDDNTLRLDTLKKLINYIGGTIMVESEPKKGTKFIVTIDQKIELEEEKTTKTVTIKKVLVVSEDQLLQKTLNKMSLPNVLFDLVESGETALNNIRNNEKYNLVILDDSLKKLNYKEVFNRLININDFNTPVVALKEKITNVETIELKSRGFADVLKKPINKKDLKEIIKDI